MTESNPTPQRFMPAPKHLLCLYPWLEIGGADKFNLDLLGCLRARGWRTTVVTTLPSRHPWRTNFERVADEILDLAQFAPDDRPGQLIAWIRERPIDLALISHSGASYRLLPYLRQQLPDLPIADYCHMEEMHWENGGFPRQSARQSRWLDRQIVSSEHLKQWLCDAGAPAGQIEVCTTNIDLADWNPDVYPRAQLRTDLQLPPEAPVALYAGRLVPQKQPVLALKVMQQVVAAHPDVIFLIAGDGPYAGYIRGVLKHYGLTDRIRLLGAVSNQRMRELLAVSDVFFLPSEMEGISLAIFEAMAMRVVPVSAEVGGQAELVVPECGMLIRRGPNEADAYRAALLKLLADRATLTRWGRAARERLQQHFRLDQMGDRMESIFVQTINAYRGAARRAVSATEAEAARMEMIGVAHLYETELREVEAARPTWRRRIKKAYWRLVDRGLWWLVPCIEPWRRRIQGS